MEFNFLQAIAEKQVSVKLEALEGRRASRDAEDEQDNGKATPDRAALGISVAPLTPELRSQLRVGRDAQGLVVRDVDPDGRAADAGIRAGDVIQEVNRQAVGSVEELRSAVRRTGDKPALLLINRQGTDVFVTVKPANG